MNNWLDKLERKFSRYAIPNLITYYYMQPDLRWS